MDTKRHDSTVSQESLSDLNKYSPEFWKMVEEKGLKKLLKECHFEGDIEAWREQRETVAKLIKEDGKILDFGCANGFLLACLKEWSDKKLECYGLDSNPVAVERARELFPEGAEDHFPFMTEEAQKRFPKKFQTIYWNVWDGVDFTEEKRLAQLRSLEEYAKGGRVILGFYHADPKENEKKMRDLQGRGYSFTEVKKDGNGHIFAALDIPEKT